MGAILTDEIGIEFALLGKFRARARYRPVYERVGQTLRAVAAHGEMAITQNGVEVGAQAMLGNDPSPAARQAMDLLALTLIVRNHQRSDADLLDLHLDFPNGPSREISLEALEELAAPDIGTARITLFVDGPKVSGQLKAAGWRLGLIARLDDAWLADSIAAAKPDVVRMEGEWLVRAGESVALAALMARFVETCRDAGAEVLLANIRDRQQLEIALQLGAGLFVGQALGPSLPAGSVMNLAPLPLAGLTAQNIVPFARRWRPA